MQELTCPHCGAHFTVRIERVGISSEMLAAPPPEPWRPGTRVRVREGAPSPYPDARGTIEEVEYHRDGRVPTIWVRFEWSVQPLGYTAQELEVLP